MTKILVAGPTFIDKIAYLDHRFKRNTVNSVSYCSQLTGGSYTIASNLANLGVEAHFATRFANDEFAFSMLQQIKDRGVQLYEGAHFSRTPVRNIYGQEYEGVMTTFEELPFDVHLSKNDCLSISTDCTFGVFSLMNSHATSALMNNHPGTKWIAEKYIPAPEFFKKIEGIVLEYGDAAHLTDPLSFPILGNKLCSQGVKWVIITNRGQGAWFYNGKVETYIPATPMQTHNYFIGVHELFVAYLAKEMAQGKDIIDAFQYALTSSCRKLDEIEIIDERKDV